MAGQANGGQVTQPNPPNQGKYVGNPNHGNVDRQGNLLPPILNKEGIRGFGGAATPEYLKDFKGLNGQAGTMDRRMYTLDGKQQFGSSSYISALTKHLESIGQGNLLKGGTYTPQATAPSQQPTIPPIQTIAPPTTPTVQPPNINTLAAEGIRAAGTATGQGLGFTPQQVAVAGNSASVTPTNVVGSDVVNANVVGSNVNPALNAVTGSNVDASQYDVTGSNIDASANDVTGTNVAGSNITAQQVGQQNASPQVMAERLANTNMAQYMNPYTDQVIRANEVDVLRGANMGLDMLGAQAQAAGGFGGSRHGIAMGEIGRGMADTLARTSAGLRQAGYQNAQQAAGQDIANNFQSQMANQQGGQFDVNTNMQRQLANQGANLQASQQNQQNALQAGLANQQNTLQARLANQSAGMQGQLANQQNALQVAGMNQGTGMQGALSNQADSLRSQGMNQQYGMQGQLANQSNALQAALANQSAGMQSGLANQSNALNSALANQNYNFQGQRANQQAGQQDISNRLQAALANQSAGLSGNAQRMGAAQQLGSLSNLGFNMGQTVNNNLAQQGAMQQALQQVILDNARAKFAGYTGQPAAGIGYLSQALGNTPTTNTQTLTKTPGLFDYLTLGASMMPGS